jgi:type IV pilus assembly protein PilX
MNIHKNSDNSYPMPGQRGAALIIAMVFLLLLTILGVTAMGTTSLQEKMAGNVRNKDLAFQAAEAALISGENWVLDQIKEPEPDNSIGLYEFDSTTSQPVWNTVNWDGTSNLVVYPDTPTQSGGSGLTGVKTQPKYIIEVLAHVPEAGGSLRLGAYASSFTTILRITARGTGGTDNAVAMVQSTFQKAF